MGGFLFYICPMQQNNTQIFGIRAIIEAIKSGSTIDKVFIQKGLRGDLFNELDQLLRTNAISTSFVPPEKLNRLTKKNHQGVIALISPVEFYDLDSLVLNVIEAGHVPKFLILDQLSDVRNFGAIIRTAECTGVHGIIIQKKGGAPVNADAVKTSAGAIFKIPICKVDHIKDAIYHLQSSGIQIVAATEKTDHNVYDVDFTVPIAIVMGSEGKGVSPSVLKIVDHKAKLPMHGEIASLNVSVACGAFLYELVRQRLN